MKDDDGLILEGLVVLELASVLAGPSVGMFLAELGARVIKVEHFLQGGDVTRSWRGKSESREGISAYFSAVNWGKESIGIDLKTSEGQALLHRFAQKADIVLASFKPGDAARLKMDYASLSAENPGLIYASINAYGANNPRPGYDAIIQAEAGFTYMNGTPESGPTKMPVALMDVLAAHQLKEALLLALLRRARTGKGGEVSVSLLQAGVASLVNQATNWLVAKKIPQPIGSDHPNIVPYGTNFLCRDGKWLVLAVGSDRQFLALCVALGHPEWAEDARFARNPDRVVHKAALLALLRPAFARQDRSHWLALLEQANVPAGAVRNMEEVFQDAELAQEMVIEDGDLQGVSGIAFAGIPKKKVNLLGPPAVSQHTFTLLQEFANGSNEELREWMEKGIIGNPNG